MNRVFFPFPGLVEIRTVDTGCVVIKGVASSQYLCMEANGKLYGSVSHLKLQLASISKTCGLIHLHALITFIHILIIHYNRSKCKTILHAHSGKAHAGNSSYLLRDYKQCDFASDVFEFINIYFPKVHSSH